jgi:hypothetical protein
MGIQWIAFCNAAHEPLLCQAAQRGAQQDRH